MTWAVEEIPDGSCVVDCITRIATPDMARALRADGVDGVIQYVGRFSAADPGMQRAHLENILGAGLGFLGMCYADDFAGARRAADFAAAGAMSGTTLGTDLESYHLPAAQCVRSLSAAFHDVSSALFLPSLYNGAGHPLSGDMLGLLPFHRYHRSLSYSVPMPVYQGAELGYSMIQEYGDPRDRSVDWRDVRRGGINVDVNKAQADNLGRRLTWMIDK
jgi:hypothetical protein